MPYIENQTIGKVRQKQRQSAVMVVRRGGVGGGSREKIGLFKNREEKWITGKRKRADTVNCVLRYEC